MPTQLLCVRCAPPGSGRCKDCQSAEGGGRAICASCYGSERCRGCNGTGFELTTFEKAKDVLLSLWWISSLGFIVGFAGVGFEEYRTASSEGSGISNFCLALLIITILLWAFFFYWDNNVRGNANPEENWQSLATLSTVALTILSIYTIMGIFFFVYVAPRVR